MTYIKQATIDDYLSIIEMLSAMSNEEKLFLEYMESQGSVQERIHKNIKEGHVVLFTHKDKSIGFLEYDTESLEHLWIYSLYFIERYRKEVFGILLPTFNLMKKAYSMPIHFVIHMDNTKMLTIAKFIKAQRVRNHRGGRIEYQI